MIFIVWLDVKKLYLARRLKYKFGGYKRKGNGCTGKVIIVILLCAGALFAAEQRIGSMALRLGEARAENEIKKECNRIAAQLLEKYKGKFSYMTQDGETTDKYSMIAVDFAEVNNFKCELTDYLTEYLKSYDEVVCYVPIGALLPSDIFAAQGVKLPIGITVSGNAEVELIDDFDSAGINQTRHRLMLRTVVRIQLHTVADKTESEIISDIPLNEYLAIGNVPSWINE